MAKISPSLLVLLVALLISVGLYRQEHLVGLLITARTNVESSADAADAADAEAVPYVVGPDIRFTNGEPKDTLHNNVKDCELVSNPTHRHALARIIVFQQDGGYQLVNLMAHYSQVLDYDNIVLIDHKGEDQNTASLLKQYAESGVHVWRCNGEWRRKGAMWSAITRVYGNDSDFVFPLDIDELVAVWNFPEPRNASLTWRSATLEWSKEAFLRAMQRANETYSGKPFKIHQVMPVPIDCPFDNTNNASHSASHKPGRPLFHPGDICGLRFGYPVSTAPPYACMNKCFGRGSEFLDTCKGNHNMRTFKYQGWNQKLCETKKSVEAVFEQSDLGILHVQSLKFSDWFTHGIRGAESMKWNLPENSNCPTSGLSSTQYCRFWKVITKAHFSQKALREVYRREFCPKHTLLYPLSGVTGNLCSL